MLKDAYTYLTEHGIKPSPQRMAVMEYLIANPVHPTVEAIHAALVGRMPTLSKTTVYNTLKLFVESGAAQVLTINEKMTNFDADVEPHAHFLCAECGEIYDIAENEERIVLVAQTGVGVVVIPDLLHVLLLQVNHDGVVHAVEPGSVAQHVGELHAVAGLELAVSDHINGQIDTLLLQTVDEMIQGIQTLGIKDPGGGDALALGEGEDVGGVPLSIQLMQTHAVDTDHSKTLCHLFGIVMLREVGAAVEHDAPELGKGAVLKAEVISGAGQKTMLAGGFLIFKNKGDIHGHAIRVHINGNVSGHDISSFLFICSCKGIPFMIPL